MCIRRNFISHALCLLMLLFVASCGSESRVEVKKQDPLWSEFIKSHTVGTVSKKTNITIKFVSPVVDSASVGKSAEEHIGISPSAKWTITFSDVDTIVAVPAEDLESGRQYIITVKGKGLIKNLPEKLGNYEFGLDVIKQEYEVRVTGLSVEEDNVNNMEAVGTILTADVESGDKVEKILSSEYLGKNLETAWVHDADGKRHEFTVKGIARQEKEERVALKWNGSSIGVNVSGEDSLIVPPINVFKVLDVSVVQESGKQYITASFSDNISKKQNLAGLIRVGMFKITARVEGNVIKIYPEKQFVGEVDITLDKGIQNEKGSRLKDGFTKHLKFVSQKPQVRFSGKGAILPDNKVLAIPFEAINVNSVQITAFRIFENNMGQFLQNNNLDGGYDLYRVGRYKWRKTLYFSSPEFDKWNRYNIDISDVLRKDPGGMYRFTISINRGNSAYGCSDEDNKVPVAKEPPFSNNDDGRYMYESSNWNSYEYDEEDGDYNYTNKWTDRENPCKDAYYMYGSGVKDTRNFLASNIGLIVKRGKRGHVNVAATRISTAEPLSGVKLSFMNYQNQVIKTAQTDSSGLASTEFEELPYYVVAEKDNDKAYLKITSGVALPTSHFDVSGEVVTSGIKGHIYGERGVWRPGDDIHLTFVLQDKEGVMPKNHPATIKLFNPKGQLIKRVTNSSPVGGFYAFKLKTADDALTGNWQAKVEVGGAVFSKTLKIETVIPNRLKVELDLGGDKLYRSKMPLKGKVSSQWLHGAIAASLKTDVQVKFASVPTKFDRYTDYIFDDPTREYKGEPITIFDGRLNENGLAEFDEDLSSIENAPGVLRANVITRVFEEGGAWSSNRTAFDYYPYKAYVGIKLPKGDAARNMLLTDKVHTVSIATVDEKGEPVGIKKVEVTLYKLDWRWWWDRSGNTLASFASSNYSSPTGSGVITTSNGQGSWNFEVKSPSWGRYLLRACDVDGKHCSGRVFYIDWPGWAGRAQEEGGDGANVLTFYSDKPKYNVGETAVIQLPEVSHGKALVSIENGTRVIDEYWVELKEKGKKSFELKLKADMAPNIYVSVTLLQPHAGKGNDRPIRLYGIIPIMVDDPATVLKPKLKAADEWRPKTKVKVEVSEESGREMTYTVAIVDEGLLGLTSFKTPQLHGEFYMKELLGVATWDLYDYVVGSYGAELERLLALGGDEDKASDKGESDNKRFPPVVRFLGPFTLGAGKTNTHEVDLPNYLGAVRTMVVAGEKGAYGSTDKTTVVREPITLIATLPRVIGPEEELAVPVSVFVNDPKIKQVKLDVIPDKMFEVVESGTVNLVFDKPGEKIGSVSLKVKSKIGKGKVGFVATGGGHKSEFEINIDVRTPNPVSVESIRKSVPPGESWEEKIVPHGISGTNEVFLEVSAVPPLDLERRLHYLIRYPHGCIEQTTSAVFPQLYLSKLVKLNDTGKKEVENNVKIGIDRLRSFQSGNGGFVYWPGDSTNSVTPWGTNYAGHFLLEAEKLGYYVPPDMLSNWKNYQKSAAQSWQPGYGLATLDQAYRLYTLALAGSPEIGAMNRLKEVDNLDSTSKWLLAAAYYLAGQQSVAPKIVSTANKNVGSYSSPGYTYGSPLRDKGVILLALVTMKDFINASDVVKSISDELAGNYWHSTQSLAYSLMAISKYVGGTSVDSNFVFEQKIGGSSERVTSDAPIYLKPLTGFPQEGGVVGVRNASKGPLTVSVIVKGIPKAGSETPNSSGLQLSVTYTDMKGHAIDPSNLAQGTDFKANVHVTNTTTLALENVALTHIVPSGWEIRNARFDEDASTPVGIDYQDIKDDRIYTYFGISNGQTKVFTVVLNAAYLGKYYLPGIYVEAMYEATKNARLKGQWVTISKSKK